MGYTLTDWDIQALVDNELSYERSKYILNLILKDEIAHKRYKELLDQKKTLKKLYTK